MWYLNKFAVMFSHFAESNIGHNIAIPIIPNMMFFNYKNSDFSIFSPSGQYEVFCGISITKRYSVI